MKNWEEMEKTGDLLYTAYVLPDKSKVGANYEKKYGTSFAKNLVHEMIEGGETWVVAGRPVFLPLEEYCKSAGIAISSDIQVLMMK